MWLKMLGCNFKIKSSNVHHACMSIINLKDEGTVLDKNGDISYNDIDNDLFKAVCKNLLVKTNKLDPSDFNELLNVWNWNSSFDDLGDIDDVYFSQDDFLIDDKSEDIILFRAIAPYVEDYSNIIFYRDDYDNIINQTNNNFMQWEFCSGKIYVKDCVYMTFGHVVNSQYDVFNQIKPIYLNINVNNVVRPVKYNPSTFATTSKSYQTMMPQVVCSFNISNKDSNKDSCKDPDKGVKYGGYCKKCKLYDDYAEQDSLGEIICYKCI